MNVDSLMVAAGLADERLETDTPWTEEMQAVLADHAEAAIRAGVRVDLDEWASLSGPSRAALVAAGNRVRSETAFLIGRATWSELDAAAVLSESDGGDMTESIVLERAVAEALEPRK